VSKPSLRNHGEHRVSIMTLAIIFMSFPWLIATGASAQQGTGQPTQQSSGQRIERRLAVGANASIKAFVPTGSVSVVTWDRDSVVVTGTVADGETFFFGGNRRGAKFGVEGSNSRESAPSHLVIHVPTTSLVSIKCASADIDATNASGWFYTVDGNIRLSGHSREVEAEAMSGDITMTVSAPWVRARTGSGTLTLGGQVTDADASSITGPVLISAAGLTRGKFGSVTGNVVFAAALGDGGIFDFDNHSGAVELRLPSATAGSFQLTTVEGTIDDNITALKPASLSASRGQTLAFRLGSGGAHVTVRTFKGTIRLRH
jgi:hypothetical protein